MSAPGDCLFCAISTGSIPADIVAENDLALAFRDIAPKAPTHVLVIPKRHVKDAAAVGSDDGELLAAMMTLAQRVADEEGVAKGGYRLVFNVGDDAGNSVPHLHLHVVGGRPLHWPPG